VGECKGRSSDVWAVWRECGLPNGFELMLDVVGVAEEMDE